MRLVATQEIVTNLTIQTFDEMPLDVEMFDVVNVKMFGKRET